MRYRGEMMFRSFIDFLDIFPRHHFKFLLENETVVKFILLRVFYLFLLLMSIHLS